MSALRRRLVQAIERSWYRPRPNPLLVPLSVIFGAVVGVRRLIYRSGLRENYRADRPVLVVGNISVGGTGKTPLVMAIIERAQALGIRVGVVSRGYGGRARDYPLAVGIETSPQAAGDEPLLIVERTGVPVVVDPVRARAARQLCDSVSALDLIIADDGLQHYPLGRDAEIAVVEARRGYGNGWLLPAGPLREPRSRLRDVALELVNGVSGDFSLVVDTAENLVTGQRQALDAFAGRTVHAVAGIGDPGRFFTALEAAGIAVEAHPFADHHAFVARDLDFGDEHAVLMTEKDAVKCRRFAGSNVWAVRARVVMADEAAQRIDQLLRRLVGAETTAQPESPSV
ncbi:tetraacyldisaccharide 4'-kinase [Salinisphaera sp. Q1T1-3]|uniref:tetraacyldisaccharide 4'-kinase n=1 Tax=Salinisphaera sp. Q1T1-3 TaxID=2321229 RepID=UPI0018F53FA4|nr:tetraacyldisaccharide 4'-kinase [Salinisphaera sp. Q1T1-3]